MNKSSKNAVEQKLDEDFPALSSFPLKKSSNAQHQSQIQSQNSTQSSNEQSNGNAWKEFESFNITIPESITSTTLTPQDFVYSLSTSLNLIPDVPYEEENEMVQTTKEGNSYPEQPYIKLLQPEFFKKYDLQTLFFIFFYFPNSSQQYFAGRELKRRQWVFHKKYQTWFHRIGEPSERTETYEIGKFEYFEYGTNEGWCIRVRSPFKFEYRETEN